MTSRLWCFIWQFCEQNFAYFQSISNKFSPYTTIFWTLVHTDPQNPLKMLSYVLHIVLPPAMEGLKSYSNGILCLAVFSIVLLLWLSTSEWEEVKNVRVREFNESIPCLIYVSDSQSAGTSCPKRLSVLPYSGVTKMHVHPPPSGQLAESQLNREFLTWTPNPKSF